MKGKTHSFTLDDELEARMKTVYEKSGKALAESRFIRYLFLYGLKAIETEMKYNTNFNLLNFEPAGYKMPDIIKALENYKGKIIPFPCRNISASGSA
jgi:hypothetical protein